VVGVPKDSVTLDKSNIECNCAHIPPTMPTYRSNHLIDCPIRIAEAIRNVDQMRESFEKAREALAKGPEAVVEFLRPSSEEEALAAYSRGPGKWAKSCLYCKGYPQFKECYCEELE
jgi:hypothetical protein